ncbi:MAG: UPF0175 family protein [Chloroflexota bacterium]|nr:UPF0175 family protein [Chloroflexota bacterium]
MLEIKLNCPEGLAEAVRTTPAELETQIRLMAALKMFELGKLSSGKAAELAGLSRVEFLDVCGRYHVPLFNYPPPELESELQADLRALRGNEG